MKREDLRKVEVKKRNDEIVQGYFHQWAVSTNGNNEQIKPVLAAIVELEDGSIIAPGAGRIKFLD